MKRKMTALLCIFLFLIAAVSVTLADANREIQFDQDAYVVYIGKPVKIAATVEKITDEAPKNTSLIWSSSDPGIAKVSNNGTVTGAAAGKVTVTACAKDDETIQKSVEVEVRVPVKSIKMDPASATLLVGASDDLAKTTLHFTVSPEDAFHQDVIWTSSDEKIATVDESGTVTALAAGSVKITAVSTDPSVSQKAVCSIKIVQAVTEITLSQTEATVAVSKSVTLKAAVSPSNAGDKGIDWSSSDESVATVSSGGAVKGVGKGTAVITATAKDGSGITAACTVTVVTPVKKLILSEEKQFMLPVGLTYQLKVTAEPAEADLPGVIWTSSNEKVATVDENGLVTALDKGNATITATAADGSGVKATTQVKCESFALVFTTDEPQTTTFYYSGGDYKVSVSVKNGCVSLSGIPEVISAPGASLEKKEFTVTPEKPGTDEIIIQAGRINNKYSVYVSPQVFAPNNGEDSAEPSQISSEKFIWEGIEWGTNMEDVRKQCVEKGIWKEDLHLNSSDYPDVWTKDVEKLHSAAFGSIDSIKSLGTVRSASAAYKDQFQASWMDWPVYEIQLTGLYTSLEKTENELCSVLLYLNPEDCGMKDSAELFKAVGKKMEELYGHAGRVLLEDGTVRTWYGADDTVISVLQSNHKVLSTERMVCIFIADRTAEARYEALKEAYAEQRRAEILEKRASDNRSYLDEGKLDQISITMNKRFGRIVLGESDGWQFTLTGLSVSESGEMSFTVEGEHPDLDKTCFVDAPRDLTVGGKKTDLINKSWLLVTSYRDKVSDPRFENPGIEDFTFSMNVYSDHKNTKSPIYTIGPVTIHIKGNYYDVSNNAPIDITWPKPGTENAEPTPLQIEQYLTLTPSTADFDYSKDDRYGILFAGFEARNNADIPLSYELVNIKVNGLPYSLQIRIEEIAPGDQDFQYANFILYQREGVTIPASLDEIETMEFCINIVSGDNDLFLSGPYIIHFE